MSLFPIRGKAADRGQMVAHSVNQTRPDFSLSNKSGGHTRINHLISAACYISS